MEAEKYLWVEYKENKWSMSFEKICEMASGGYGSAREKGIYWYYLSWWVGTGKTYCAVLAALIGITVFKRTAFYISTEELWDRLRPSSDEYTLKETMFYCRNAEILILDDLGQEKLSEWVRSKLMTIVDYRYRSKATTIFTSNRKFTDLQTWLDHPAVISRIGHYSKEINFKWENVRNTPIL